MNQYTFNRECHVHGFLPVNDTSPAISTVWRSPQRKLVVHFTAITLTKPFRSTPVMHFLHKAVLLVPCAVSLTSHLVVLNRVMSIVGHLKRNRIFKQEPFNENIHLKTQKYILGIE